MSMIGKTKQSTNAGHSGRKLLLSIVLLGSALLLAFGIGAAAGLLIRAVWPGMPVYVVLALGGVMLVPILWWLGGHFPFLGDWFYLMPAIIFLLVFTLYPIILTVYFAFTDYSPIHNGRVNLGSLTQITELTGQKTLLLKQPAASALACQASCEGLELQLRSGNRTAQTTIEQVEGNRVVLSAAPPFAPREIAKINAIHAVGFANFREIAQTASVALWPVFIWNIVFAGGVVGLTALTGLVLGVVLNSRRLKLRNFYRTLLILPWAIPIVISAPIWQAMLNYNFGAINRLIGVMGGYPVPWLQDGDWAKVGILIVGLWAGFPYMMTATLGSLATIPDELYEAAEIDGATWWQAFTGVTLPLLREPALPILLSSFAFNFNNFVLIYLITGGGPAIAGGLPTAQGTDILISWAYKTAFSSSGFPNYGLAAALALIIFLLTVGISMVNFYVTGVFREARQ